MARCAGVLLSGGLGAASRCRAGCEAEQASCARAASLPAAPDAAAARHGRAEAPVANEPVAQALGKRKLGLLTLVDAPDLRRIEVPALDGVPLLVAGDRLGLAVTRFIEDYRARRIDTLEFGDHAGYETKPGGDGRPLLSMFAQASSVAMDETRLRADLANGPRGSTLTRLLDRNWRAKYHACVADPSSRACTGALSSGGDWIGDNEFARERSKTAFVGEASAKLKAAFAGRPLELFVLEQRQLGNYDFAGGFFRVAPHMSQGLLSGSGTRAPDPAQAAFLAPVAMQLDRRVADELRIPKAEAEAWLKKVEDAQGPQPPNARTRDVFSLARLKCAPRAPSDGIGYMCQVLKVELFADTGLGTKLADL